MYDLMNAVFSFPSGPKGNTADTFLKLLIYICVWAAFLLMITCHSVFLPGRWINSEWWALIFLPLIIWLLFSSCIYGAFVWSTLRLCSDNNLGCELVHYLCFSYIFDDFTFKIQVVRQSELIEISKFHFSSASALYESWEFKIKELLHLIYVSNMSNALIFTKTFFIVVLMVIFTSVWTE